MAQFDNIWNCRPISVVPVVSQLLDELTASKIENRGLGICRPSFSWSQLLGHQRHILSHLETLLQAVRWEHKHVLLRIPVILLLPHKIFNAESPWMLSLPTIVKWYISYFLLNDIFLCKMRQLPRFPPRESAHKASRSCGHGAHPIHPHRSSTAMYFFVSWAIQWWIP